MTTARKAARCVSHHSACDCREYRAEQMEQALKIIHTWASVPRGLDAQHVTALTEKALGGVSTPLGDER